MRLILLILVFVLSLLLAGTTASAGISTKKKDILKLIGTTYAPNSKFAWIELNGEDYGWTREGRNVGKYRIVMVEMGKVIVESGRKTLVLVMLEGTQFELSNEINCTHDFFSFSVIYAEPKNNVDNSPKLCLETIYKKNFDAAP